MSKIVDLCEECLKNNDWKFCPASWKFCPRFDPAELKPESKPKMTQEEFDVIFLKLLKEARKVVWLTPRGRESELPTFRFELRNSDNEWMFDISLDSKNPHFWFSWERVATNIVAKNGPSYEDVQRLMKNQLAELFNLNDVTPTSSWIAR